MILHGACIQQRILYMVSTQQCTMKLYEIWQFIMDWYNVTDVKDIKSYSTCTYMYSSHNCLSSLFYCLSFLHRYCLIPHVQLFQWRDSCGLRIQLWRRGNVMHRDEIVSHSLSSLNVKQTTSKTFFNMRTFILLAFKMFFF